MDKTVSYMGLFLLEIIDQKSKEVTNHVDN